MLCKGCGKVISDDSMFCPFCGRRAEAEGTMEENKLKERSEQANRPVFQVPPEKSRGPVNPAVIQTPVPKPMDQVSQDKPDPPPLPINRVPQEQIPQLINQAPQASTQYMPQDQIPKLINQAPQVSDQRIAENQIQQPVEQIQQGQTPRPMNQMPQGQMPRPINQIPQGQMPESMSQMPQGMPGQILTYGNQAPQAPYNQMPQGQIPRPMNQMPQGQMPESMSQMPQGMPGQMPTYGKQAPQAPYNQMPPGQMPRPMNQMLQGQMPQQMNQMPQGMPGQMPTYGNQAPQAPYSQMPQGQMPRPMNQMPQGQMPRPMNQMPQGQMPRPMNQMPQGQIPQQMNQMPQGMPGQWGPAGPGSYPPNYPELPGNKKKRKGLILSIVVSLIAILAIITVLAFPKLKEVFGNDSDKKSEENDERDIDKKDKDDERLLEEEDEKPFVMTDPTPTAAPAGQVIESDFIPIYSYSELPDVLSLNSDKRFLLNDSLVDSGIATYQFYIVGTFNAESDFIDALDNYSYMLQQTNGFVYEQQFSEEEYANSGDPILYLTRGDDWLSIVPSFDENAAYVHIYNVANLSEAVVDMDTSSYFYDTYLHGRDETEFVSDSYVTIENGDLFYLKDVYSEDLGDGTKEIEVSLDMAGYYTGLYLNDYDFVILSKDTNGNIITDASPIVSVRDEYGNELSMPLVLNADAYDSYSLIFYIPVAAEYITLYATNTNYGVPAGTLYYTEYSMN